MKKAIFFIFTLVWIMFSGQAFASEGLVKYTVKRGDSISKIARAYHQPSELVAVINNISVDDTIRVGEKLLVPVDPSAERIVLEEGDNPWDIANKYGITAEKLIAANDIADPTKLMPGDIINVPVVASEEEPDIVPPKRTLFTAQKPRKERMKLSYRDEGKFIWPVTGPISSGYGTRWGDEFHHGLDIAADQGTPIVAAEGGKIIFAGYKNRIYGNTVMIESERYTLLYAHMSKVVAEDGQTVGTGEEIGLVGDTGRTTGPHLHLEVRSGGDTLNPLRFLP